MFFVYFYELRNQVNSYDYPTLRYSEVLKTDDHLR